MECMGRMAEILICIVCLTIVPAKSMLQLYGQQRENVAGVEAERFYAGLLREGRLTKEAYGQFQEIMGQRCGDKSFEVMVARRYVMPAGEKGGASAGFPVKILYRADLEEIFQKTDELVFEGTVFVSVSIYDKDGLLYVCGGEV